MEDQPIQTESSNTVPLRPASQVMRLARMGSLHQSRLSFMRVLLRRLKVNGWVFDRPVWRINEKGSVLPPTVQVDRNAATHWWPSPMICRMICARIGSSPRPGMRLSPCMMAILTRPTLSDLAPMFPNQEAGRISEAELSLSRANRSVRLFDYVAACLAAGTQPDVAKIEPVGYLMRTTAVYGSGKFGAADRDLWAERPEFVGSFQPELLSVWLIRAFTIDMVEHMARMRAPKTAVRLDPAIRRRIGVGNSTGLGMAPFLINHPALIHSWIKSRRPHLPVFVRSNRPANRKLIFSSSSYSAP